MPLGKSSIVYVTSSPYKKQENDTFVDKCKLDDGTLVKDVVEFEFREKPVLQILEVDIQKMVREGVAKAYSQIGVPCIVEYAGLVFDKYKTISYPGGLTKAMWNALGDNFLVETQSQGQRAIARAVVGYCDGKVIRTFVGETNGTLADTPRGKREFYWDTVFMPDDPNAKALNKTYSEIVEDPNLGLEYKMQHLSQSGRAMRKLLEFVGLNPRSGLWT
jgi:XTP/dITP diphosphohydrolase